MRKIGIFGGTFDPPHMGHVILAAEAADQLCLDKVLWMPSPEPPHKQNRNVSSYAERVELVRACIEDEPKFDVCLIESERPGPHYTCDTMRILNERHPDWQIVLLIGGDSLHDLPTWYKPDIILDEIWRLGVMRRPDDVIDLRVLVKDFPDISEKLSFVDAPLLEISSTEIRERVASGHHFRYYLRDSVYRIIRDKGYYK